MFDNFMRQKRFVYIYKIRIFVFLQMAKDTILMATTTIGAMTARYIDAYSKFPANNMRTINVELASQLTCNLYVYFQHILFQNITYMTYRYKCSYI